MPIRTHGGSKIIAQNQATVNSLPSTVRSITCPACHGRRVADTNTGLPGKPNHAPCGDCGGSGTVEDGIGPAAEGGFDVFVEGIYSWETTEGRAAERYSDEVRSLAVQKTSPAWIVQRQASLNQWRKEFNEVEVLF